MRKVTHDVALVCCWIFSSSGPTTTFAFPSKARSWTTSTKSSLPSSISISSSRPSSSRLFISQQQRDEQQQQYSSYTSTNNNKSPPPSVSTSSSSSTAISVEPRIRQAYMEWCRNFGKTYVEGRLPTFQQNYLRMEQYAQQTGEQVRFNEYADLTTQEYREIILQSSSGGSSGVNDSKRRRRTSSEPKAWMRFMTYTQTAIIGGFVGGLSVLPAQALHYLYLQDYSYTTYGQWQWDWMVAVLQAGLFSNMVRFALREDVDNSVVVSRLIWSLILIKSLVRITVTPDCAAYTWIYCAEPYYLLNEEMGRTLLINLLESWTLFTPVALTTQSLLQRNQISPYEGFEGKDEER